MYHMYVYCKYVIMILEDSDLQVKCICSVLLKQNRSAVFCLPEPRLNCRLTIGYIVKFPVCKFVDLIWDPICSLPIEKNYCSST